MGRKRNPVADAKKELIEQLAKAEEPVKPVESDEKTESVEEIEETEEIKPVEEKPEVKPEAKKVNEYSAKTCILHKGKIYKEGDTIQGLDKDSVKRLKGFGFI